MTKVSNISPVALKNKKISGGKPIKETQQRGTIVFPLQYNLCNTTNPYYDLWLHWHAEFELIHVLNGTYHCFINNRDIKLEKDDICIIPGKIIHGDAPEKSQALYESIVFDIEMLRLHSYSSDLFLNDILSDNITLHNVIHAEETDIINAAKNIFESVKVQQDGYELITTGYLLLFFGLLKQKKHFDEKGDIAVHKRLRTEQMELVLNLIRKNYDQDLNLQEMAEIAGLSPKYFCRIFREITEKSPIEYLNWFRVNRACAMLRETEEKLPDIAFNCGFNDFSYFIKTFRRYKGMTPLKYRNFDPYKNPSPDEEIDPGKIGLEDEELENISKYSC